MYFFFPSSFLPHAAWYIDHSKSQSLLEIAVLTISHYRSFFLSLIYLNVDQWRRPVSVQPRERRTITESPQDDPPHLRQISAALKRVKLFFSSFSSRYSISISTMKLVYRLKRFMNFLQGLLCYGQQLHTRRKRTGEKKETRNEIEDEKEGIDNSGVNGNKSRIGWDL